tara:strand:- start:3371 stop:4201 length:831 start_codon:yes stop_codon:yes gene_type:complete
MGVVKLYTDISEHAEDLAINFMVVGAMARDLVFVHGYGSTIERGTRDVDFGINVAGWGEFHALRDSLLQVGYQPDEHKIYRLTCRDEKGLPWEIDIVPFGEIADDDSSIQWPPEQSFSMSVLGFSEAFEHVLSVQISEDPEIVIPVASPAGICLLKLVAWLDREIELRAKDATDFSYLIQSYSKIPEILEALYEDGYMESQEWGETKASAMKLGIDTADIASSETIEFLSEKLFNQPAKVEQFVRDMGRRGGSGLAQNAEWFDIFMEAILKGDLNS